MSSRALRKAQREREKQQQLESLQSARSEPEDGSGSEDGESEPAVAKLNAFALLNQDEEDEDEDENDELGQGDNDADTKHDEDADNRHLDADEASQPTNTASRSKRKKKKKRGKASKKNTETDSPGTGNNTPKKTPKPTDLDEIDLAIRSLSTSDQAIAPAAPNEKSKEKHELLSIDPQHLNVNNEMRRLFGRAAVEGGAGEDNDRNAGQGRRRRGRRDQELDLGQLVAARNVRGGRNTGSLGLRRNLFIQGKEEWPRATAGGLGMEVAKKLDDGVVIYKFVHNTAYRDVQNQFGLCVESMDPGRVLELLQYNPYHISTLLQASEIAKQQRDYPIAGDLIERALFSFGRSLHSTFATRLKEGKARLDFSRPENRELWLAAWRYIGNLGMRGTWRTALEWAKLILALDPEEDPYCMRLMIDQLALRSKQADYLVKLTESQCVPDSLWLPNFQLSKGLALSQLGHPQEARAVLHEGLAKHPAVFARLFQELNIDRVPPSIWGKAPSTPWEAVVTELYATHAKDIWSTPEAISLLVEIAETGSLAASSKSATQDNNNINSNSNSNENKDEDEDKTENLLTLSYARHALLADDPKVLALIPRKFTKHPGLVSDPLPPPDPDATVPRPGAPENTFNFDPNGRESRALADLFRSVFTVAPSGDDSGNDDNDGDNDANDDDDDDDDNDDSDGDSPAAPREHDPQRAFLEAALMENGVIAEERLALLVRRIREIRMEAANGAGQSAGWADRSETEDEESEDGGEEVLEGSQ
ncbi:MAG: hypothetical protein M1819_005052 [Sarea resinae]|nr:MAG: hypothetical protein M1819_005052 [Sarea resinae]